jgi:hypothetical protein
VISRCSSRVVLFQKELNNGAHARCRGTFVSALCVDHSATVDIVTISLYELVLRLFVALPVCSNKSRRIGVVSLRSSVSGTASIWIVKLQAGQFDTCNEWIMSDPRKWKKRTGKSVVSTTMKINGSANGLTSRVLSSNRDNMVLSKIFRLPRYASRACKNEVVKYEVKIKASQLRRAKIGRLPSVPAMPGLGTGSSINLSNDCPLNLKEEWQ